MLWSQLAKTQNFIADSSFETNKFTPIDFSAIEASRSWNRPSWGTADLFCECEKKKKITSLVNVPDNLMGHQEAHSGNCYAGVFAFSHGYYREYLQTPLKRPLEKNKTYRFTMHVSLADYSRAYVDQLGVCFLKEKAEYGFSDAITDLDPVYIKVDKDVGRDIAEWHKVTATYKSQGGEAYVVIGAFKVYRLTRTRCIVPKGIKTRINQNSERDSYYFIDDVSVMEILDTLGNTGPDIPASIKLTEVDSLRTKPTFILKTILFETNKALLLPSSFSELDSLSIYLNKNPSKHIEISGHTDNIGDPDRNLTLSQTRAKAVSVYLISKSIDRSRISHNGYGSSKPLVPNNTPGGRQQNRRVEFVIK